MFTEAQTRALWLRDGGFTFPSCTVPASWCDGHHLRHWVDGGACDLDNGALLCGRHHTLVHQRGDYGRVVDNRAEWDLAPGSYDHRLAAHHATARAAEAAGSTRQGRPAGADGPHAEGSGASAALTVREYDIWGQVVTGAGRPGLPPWRP